MMNFVSRIVCPSLLGLSLAGAITLPVAGAEIDTALQAKLDAQIKLIEGWASDPVLVKAVAAQNAALPPDYAAMTQDKWKSLSILDPFVRSFTKNDVGAFLKSKKSEVIVEAFVSDAAGLKVGFLGKTTYWSHKGKPKHDLPLTGKVWQGPIEVDESSGAQQVQVALPIRDGDKPIGALVVGLSTSKLGKE
jgi:hypothetical protein